MPTRNHSSFGIMQNNSLILIIFVITLLSFMRHSDSTAAVKGKKTKTLTMAPPQSAQNGSDTTKKSTFQRLPKDVVPKSYQVRVEPDLVNFTFKGSVAVNVNIEKETAKLILNAIELKIESASFTAAGDADPTAASSIELNESDELLTISMPSVLKVCLSCMHLVCQRDSKSTMPGQRGLMVDERNTVRTSSYLRHLFI